MSFFMNIPSTDIRIVGKEISNGDLYIEIMGVYNLVNYGRIYIDNEYDVIFGDHINKTNHLIKITKIIDIVRQISLHKLLNE